MTMSFVGLMAIMASSIMAPALAQIQADLHMSDVELQMALSIYILAVAFGPLVLGPLSEVFGRLPIYYACNVWFAVWALVGGFANSAGLLIAARFICGWGGSMVYAIGPGILHDVWTPEQRGRSISIYSFIPLLGSAIGPIVGGYVTERTSWRWLFWVMAIAMMIIILLSFLTYQESHEPTLLARKAAKLRQQSGNALLYTTFEVKDQGRSVPSIIRQSLLRPFRLLLTHPHIQVLALIFAFNFGLLFLTISTFADLWITVYHESIATSGLNYIAFVIGEILGAQLAAPLIDGVWKYLKEKASGEVTPEFRVPLMLPGAILVPAGTLMYGWSAQYHTHWIVPDIGVAILGCGLMSATVATQSYVIDSYPEHTASASSAATFLRSVFAFGFPLFAPAMYKSLHYGWGNSLMALIALLIGVIGPAVLWKFGATLRADGKSTY